MAKPVVSYRNYRQIHKGEFGYSPTSKRFIDEDNNTIIGRTAYETLKRGGISRKQAKETREKKLLSSPPTRSLIERFQEEHRVGKRVPTELETIRTREFRQILSDQRLLRRKFSRNVIDKIQERENVAGRFIDTPEDVLNDKSLRREVNREIRAARLANTKGGRHQRLADYTKNLNREIYRSGSDDYISQEEAAENPEFIYYDERLFSDDYAEYQEAVNFFDQEAEDAAIDYGETP